MSLLGAVRRAGPIPPETASREAKKRYSEQLSKYLAEELAEGLRSIGFSSIRPLRGGPGETNFQGGLGPKKVDVSYSDEKHGLMLAVSIKSITSPPFGKNLKNRFSDLCTEAITLHMRFPYSVVCALFAFPTDADRDAAAGRRTISTFQRATNLMATIDGRQDHTDPGEKFENVTMMLFEPVRDGGSEPSIRLMDATSGREMTEDEYLSLILSIYNTRNPHAPIGSQGDDSDSD